MTEGEDSKGWFFLPTASGQGEAWLDPKALHMSFVFLCWTAGIIYYNTMALDVCVHLAFPFLWAAHVHQG